MDTIEEVKKSLYESYKRLYEDTIEQAKEELQLAKSRRDWGIRKWSVDWFESSAANYRRAVSYKRSMNTYAN